MAVTGSSPMVSPVGIIVMFTARWFERVVAVGADEGGAGLAKVIQVTQAAGGKVLSFFNEGYPVEFLQVK